MRSLKVVCVISTGFIESNRFVVYDEVSKKCIIIDSGEKADSVIKKIDELGLTPELLINTHGHFDHAAADDKIREKYNIPLAIHEIDVEMLCDPYKNASVMTGKDLYVKAPEIILKEGIYKTSFCDYSVIHTPGHTQGSVCILIDKWLFSGDTLFKGTIGRTDFFGGSAEMMKKSLQKIKQFDKDTEVFPGHGDSTCISDELAKNIYLR